jgi:hypothetical protein
MENLSIQSADAPYRLLSPSLSTKRVLSQLLTSLRILKACLLRETIWPSLEHHTLQMPTLLSTSTMFQIEPNR